MGIDHDHPNASEGPGGLRLHGWLDVADIKDLRVGLMGRSWTVAADEPLDGGLRDAVKHLGAMLRGRSDGASGSCTAATPEAQKVPEVRRSYIDA